MQLHALELHRADVALAQHGESVEALLAALFAPESDAAEGALLASGTCTDSVGRGGCGNTAGRAVCPGSRRS